MSETVIKSLAMVDGYSLDNINFNAIIILLFNNGKVFFLLQFNKNQFFVKINS